MKLVKKLYIFLLLPLMVFGLNIPIMDHLKINAQIGNITILEFPFKIEGIKSTNFIPLLKINNNQKNYISDNKLNEKYFHSSTSNNTKKQTTNTSLASNQPPVVVTKGVNTITIYPKKFGSFTLIVWGYKFPIIIDFTVKDKASIRYYHFYSSNENKENSIKFEAVPHEEVIKKIIAYLFNRKTPIGYENVVGNKKYTVNGFEFIEIRKIIGNRYEGSEWIIKNLTNKKIKLYEQMFYRNGIYAISIENPNLGPGESTRVFFVSKKGIM